MSYQLLLTSSGIVPEIREEFLSLLKKKPEENKVAFITTAAHGASKDVAWMQKDKELLYAYGIKKENLEDLDIKDKTKSQLEKILENKDIIFVEGGNTFYLLYWAKRSGLDKMLPELLEYGSLYVGISAGSYLACPTIEMAAWKRQDLNKIGLTDLRALDLAPFLITAHFEEKYRSVIDKAAKTTNYPIVALTDKQAIIIKKNSTSQKIEIKAIGPGKKEFWNGFKEQ
ncbi:Type 1 glutamine amidotransferase-like domain-containing protein [Candidatus Woesearchaeota archaeon]|nr:Type 1 glutamine amidotransferase-like domain-containing protein [Candidatus Woesearchaeota archaeon]